MCPSQGTHRAVFPRPEAGDPSLEAKQAPACVPVGRQEVHVLLLTGAPGGRGAAFHLRGLCLAMVRQGTSLAWF